VGKEVHVMYVINFLAVAALPLAIAGYGAHLAAKVLDKFDRKRAVCIVWTLAILGVFMSGLQQVFAYRSHKAEDLRELNVATTSEKDRRQLREELQRSVQREDDLRTELDSIARFLRASHPGMDMRAVNTAASQMAERAMRQ
jgi:predicted PurR-regulated permease PerM